MRTVSWGRRTASAAVRARTGLLLIAGALVLSAVVLSGCASAPDPVPSETPTAVAPIFASDEEALAAATEAYAAYQNVIDRSLAAEEIDTGHFSDVLTGDALKSELKTASMYIANGYRSIGTSSFDSMKIQFLDSNSGHSTLSTYLCSDVSAVDVVDSGGFSIVPPSRADRYPLVVEFRFSDADASKLLVSSSESWAGTNFC